MLRVVLNACVTKTTAAEILANPATRRRQVTMTISLNPLRSTMQSGKVRAISSAVGRQAAPLAHGLNVNLSNPARSARGGFSTKIHLRTEGRPLAFELTGGEAHGVNGYRALMELCDGVSAEGLVVPGEALFEHHHALELSSPFPDEERAGPEADAPLRFWTSAIELQCGSSCPSCSSSSGGS